MKTLLINPPPYNHGSKSRFLERVPIQTYTMPLGLGYIAAMLEREGYEVKIIDAYVKNIPYEALRNSINEFNPDIIGVQCLSDQRASWFKLIDTIRSLNREIKIVLGGPHPSLMPEQVLTKCRPDVIVIGEGEETMLDLVRTWQNNGDLHNVKGIAYLDGRKAMITAPRERIQNLDSLPFPAYHLVDLDDYRGFPIIEALYEMLNIDKSMKYATISTSRGCVGNCAYCSAPLLWKRRWTKRSSGNIVDEIEMLHTKYGISFFLLTDDIFSVDQKRVISMCEEILKRNLIIHWIFETAVNFVSPELLNIAKRAGCRNIFYGVESGSTKILSKLSKKIKEKDVIRAFKMTKDVGILTTAFLMVGSPDETEETINDTIKLLRKIEPDSISPQITMITPGTKIFHIAKEKGFIDDNYWLTDLPFPYYTCERNLKTLLRWHRKVHYYKYSDLSIFYKTVKDYIQLNYSFLKKMS